MDQLTVRTCGRERSRFLPALERIRLQPRVLVKVEGRRLAKRFPGRDWGLPKAWRKTLTLDNGTEFARFKRIEAKTGLAVFFADPYAAWQRGTNENTNGLLRQYFLKGCDFRNVSQQQLVTVVRKLNHRPRKCLGSQTPHEVLFKVRTGALAT